MATNLGMTGLNEFKQHFASVRPTLFRVSLQKSNTAFFDGNYLNGKEGDFYFYCKGTTLPASKIQPIEVGFMGRKFYEHGDREFDPWTITLYNSQDFGIRSFFESWMNKMNMHEDNIQAGKTGNAGIGHFNGGIAQDDYYGYMLDFRVDQLDRRNNVIYTYDIINAFPTEVGEIQLDYTSTNTIEEFPVTLQYQYWTSRNSKKEKVTDQGKSEVTDTVSEISNLGV